MNAIGGRMARELDGGDLRELYANFFRVGFNASEFLLDFGRRFEDGPEEYFQRIITTPGHAKALAAVLGRSLSDYEERFGTIRPEQDL